MKTAAEYSSNIQRALTGAGVSVSPSQRMELVLPVIQQAMGDAAASMRERAVTICDDMPEQRQCFTTDRQKAAGIKHASNMCSTRIRTLPLLLE